MAAALGISDAVYLDMRAKTVGDGNEELYLRDRDEIIKLDCYSCTEEIEWECVSLSTQCPVEEGRYVIPGQYEEVFLRLPAMECSGVNITTTAPQNETTMLLKYGLEPCTAVDVTNRTTYAIEVQGWTDVFDMLDWFDRHDQDFFSLPTYYFDRGNDALSLSYDAE